MGIQSFFVGLIPHSCRPMSTKILLLPGKEHTWVLFWAIQRWQSRIQRLSLLFSEFSGRIAHHCCRQKGGMLYLFESTRKGLFGQKSGRIMSGRVNLG